MRIFNGKLFKEDWGSKYNFVDENNVFVGYDSEQGCCENADWFISDKIETKMPDPHPQPIDMPGWFFDICFFKESDRLEYSDREGNALESGGVAIFKITKDKEEKYLHLFNCHNGYYGHGFVFGIGEEVKKEGIL